MKYYKKTKFPVIGLLFYQLISKDFTSGEK